MTFPFMDDPVPPGHGESLREAPEGPRTYEVVLRIGDEKPDVVGKWNDLDVAFKEADKERDAVRGLGYIDFFVGVRDENEPERWLEPGVE